MDKSYYRSAPYNLIKILLDVIARGNCAPVTFGINLVHIWS